MIANRYSNESYLAAEVALPILLDHFSSDHAHRKTGEKDLQWQWQDNEAWRPYPAQLNAQLEAARKNNKQTVSFCLGGHKYELDFTALHQRNTLTGRVRKIRFKSAAKISDVRDENALAFNWPTLSRLLNTISKEKALVKQITGSTAISEKVLSKISDVTKALRESLKIPPEAANDQGDEARRVVEHLSKLIATHVRPCTIAAKSVGFATEACWPKDTPPKITQLSWRLACSRLEHYLENGVDASFWKSFEDIVSDGNYSKPLTVIPHGHEEQHYLNLLTKLVLKYVYETKDNEPKRPEIIGSVLRLLLSQGSPECHLKAMTLLLKCGGELPVKDILLDWRNEIKKQGSQVLRSAWCLHTFKPPVPGREADEAQHLPEVHSCSDGTHVYVLSPRWGLLKIGTGLNGTVCGQVVVHNQSMCVHGTAHVTYVPADSKEEKDHGKGFLLMRSPYFPQRLLPIDPDTLLLMVHNVCLDKNLKGLEDPEEEELNSFNVVPVVDFGNEKPTSGLYVDARYRGEWIPSQITSVSDKDTVTLHFDNPAYADKKFSVREVAPFGTHVALLPYLTSNRRARSELDLSHGAIYKANYSKEATWLTPYVRQQIFEKILTANWKVGSMIILSNGGHLMFDATRVVYVDADGKEKECSLQCKNRTLPIFYDPPSGDVICMEQREAEDSEAKDTWMVITKAGLNIRRGPNVNSPKMRDDDWLRPDEKVVALEVKSDWLRHDRGWSCIKNGVKRYMKQIRSCKVYLDRHPLSVKDRTTILAKYRRRVVCDSMIVAQQVRDYDTKSDTKVAADITALLEKISSEMGAFVNKGEKYILKMEELKKFPTLGKTAILSFLQQLGFCRDKKQFEITVTPCAQDVIKDFLRRLPTMLRYWEVEDVRIVSETSKRVSIDLPSTTAMKPDQVHCCATGVVSGDGVELYKCVHPQCNTHISKFAIMNRSIPKSLRGRRTGNKFQYEVGFPVVRSEPAPETKDSKKGAEWEASSTPYEQLELCYYDWRRGQMVLVSPHAKFNDTCAAHVFSASTGKLSTSLQLETNATSLCFATPPGDDTAGLVWAIGYSSGGNIGAYLLEKWVCLNCPPEPAFKDVEAKRNALSSDTAIAAILEAMPCIETGRYLRKSLESVGEFIKDLTRPETGASPGVATATLKLFHRYARTLSLDIETASPVVRKDYASFLNELRPYLEKLPGSETEEQKSLRVKFLSMAFPVLFPSWDERLNFIVGLHKNRSPMSDATMTVLTERYRQVYAGILFPGHFSLYDGLDTKDKAELISEESLKNIQYLHRVVLKSRTEDSDLDPSLASLQLLMLLEQFHHLSTADSTMAETEAFAVHKLLQLEKGDEVDVLDHSNWRPARIIDKKKDQSFLVHYIGFDSKYDEWQSVASGHIAPRGTKCRWPKKSDAKGRVDIAKQRARRAARCLFQVATATLSTCVSIIEKSLADRKKDQETEKQSTPLPGYASDLMLFSMFCIVRVGFEHGQDKIFDLMRSCFDLLKLGIQEPKLLSRELFILKRMLRYVLEYLFHNPTASHRVFGTDIKQKDLVSEILPVVKLPDYRGINVIQFLHKFYACPLTGRALTERKDYTSWDAATRLSVFFDYCVGQHSKITGDGYCPVDISFVRNGERGFAAAAIRMCSNLRPKGKRVSLAEHAISFAQSKQLISFMNQCREKSYRMIVFQHGQRGLPMWFRNLVAMSFVHIRKPVIVALNSHAEMREQKARKLAALAAKKAKEEEKKKAAEAKADDAKQAAPTPSSRSDAKEDTSGADEKEGGERVERKAERKGREAKSAEAKAGNEEDDAGEESERSEDGDEDAKEKNKLSPPGKNPRLSSRESSPGPGDIPKHVLTMVGKWSHNAWLIFCLTDKIPKSPLSTEKKKPPASSAEEQEEAPDYQEAVGSPVLFEKALDRKMKWINHFIKSANGLDPDRMLQWAQHAESTFNGRLMFLQSVASFNMRGGDTAAAVMIDEVFPQIWAALRNSDQVDIFQPMFRGQMSQGGAEIVRGFFQSIAAILTSYVEMDEKDLPSTDLLRFRMYILLPFISSDVSSRGVQMFLDSGIAHALCRFALSPALNRLHPSVAAMAWRSFVHLVVVYLSKTTSECSEEHRQHLDQIVDVLKSQLKSDTMEIQRAGTFQDVPLTIGAKRRAFVDSLKVDDIIDARTYSGDWRVAKVVRVKPSSVFVTWRGYVMETNENIFKDSGRLAPFTSRASLELPQRDPDFHAAPFKLKEENLRRAGPTLLKAFAAGDKAEIEELNKYRPLNFRMFRCLDVLKILAAVASPCSTVCHELLSTLINSVRHPEKAIPGVLQLEFVRLLQAHLPACDHQIKETSETLFQLFSFISGGALSEVEKLTSNQIEVEEEAVEDVTEEIEKLQQIEANKKPATQKFNMEANWRCVMCRYDNPGKMHTCANCFIPREISQPEFPLFLKEQKENEGRKKELAKKLKEDEEKRLQAQKAKAEEKKKEDKAPEEKKKKTEPQDAKESERHVFQSWSESGVRNNSHKLLTWAMTDLFRTLLNGSSPSWEKAICEQVHLALSHIPSTLESLMSMSSKYESKSPLGGERISEKSWLNACDALAALQLLGGFEGNVYEGSYVVVQQSHQIVRRGWVKTVSPKLIVELCDPPSIGGQTQEIVCHRKDITPVALLDELSESHLFGEPAETQRAEIGKILSAVLKCLEASSLSRVPVPRKSAGFLYRTSAQQLAVGTCSVICKLFLKSLAAFRAPALKIDLEMLMPLFKFTKGKNFSGGFSDTSTALPTHWNALMELGMRSSEEKKFVRDIRAASYLLRPSQTSSDGSDEKLTKPTILQHVDTLCGLGFSKNMAKAALAASNGDLGQAGHMLTDGQVLDRDSTSAWKTCLRRLDLADSVAAWERMTAKESSMNTSKWRGKPGIASPQDIHMGSDVVGKESDSDTGFEWPEDALAHPVGLVVKFRHVDYPVRNLKFILGQRVRAQDMHHEWYDAEIIEVKGDWVKLHYDKFDHFWDEWIDVKRQWRKLQIPGAKKLSAFVRTVDHGLPFNLKAGVVWKVSDQNPSIVLVKFPGSGFQPTHFIWSDINDLEPYISSTATAASASLPGPQLSASLKALNETQMSHTLAVLQRTVKDTLLSHVGVSLSVLPGLRRVRQSAGNILQLLSCLSNPWNWTDDSDCSRFSEPAKLLVQELARAIGVNLLEETFETTGNACAERVRKKQLEQLSIDSSSGKTVGAGVEGIVLSEKPSWESLVVLLKSALQEEMKQFEVHSTQCTCEVRCQANGSYFIAAKGFSKTMVAFDRSYGGSPTVQFYSDRHRNRMLKKVACAVPPPFAMRLPLYVTVEGCSQEEGLSFLRRMVCFTPLHCNSLDILYVLVELLLYLINHPLVKSDETKSSGLQGLMSEAYRSLLRTSAKMWGEESPAAMPSLLKMQMLEVMSRLCIHQLTYKELPKVFSPCIEEIRSGGVLNGVLEEAAMRYDVEIGTSKASKDGLLSERGKPKLGKFLSRSTYLVKHVEFLTCVWEYMRRFKPSVFEEISQLEKKEETKKPVVTSTTPKPAPTQWSCPTCTYKNPPARTRCEMCGGAREQPSEPAPPKSPTPAEKKKDDTKTRERDLEKTNQLKLVVARLREIMSSSKMHEIGPVVTEGKAKTPADEKPGAGDGKATELKYVKGATLACKDTCGKWIDAEVRDTKENEIFVHYVNYDDRWDEWISTSSQRLRPRGDPAKDSKSTDEKKRDPEVSDKVVESICLLDLSLNSVWWPLFLHRVPQAREDLESEAKRAEGIDLTHEYSLTPLVPLAALLFDKKVRLALFDAIIKCSTIPNRKLPEITVDTSNIIGMGGAAERRSGSGLFGQIKHQFKRLSVAQFRGKLGEYSWATRWKGGRNQGSEGLPGPFQQSMGMIWTELNERAQRRDTRSPVILCPNGDLEIGDKDRDNLLLNPGLKSPSSFRCLGQLLGCVLRSSSSCSLPFSRTVWRALVYGHAHIIRRGFFEKIAELESFDKNQGRQLVRLITQSEAEFAALGYTYTTSLSNGRVIELFAGGHKHRVAYEDRLFYAELVLNARLEENVSQTDLVRQGVLAVIPRYSKSRHQTELSPICYLMTLEELERRVCGSPEIDLDLLKRKTVYKGAKDTSKIVEWFWNVMHGLSKRDRQRFIQFAWARSRLPHDMATNNNIKMLLNFTKSTDRDLPKAQTCFFLVDMPMYSSEEIMRDKLLLALNCDEINS